MNRAHFLGTSLLGLLTTQIDIKKPKMAWHNEELTSEDLQKSINWSRWTGERFSVIDCRVKCYKTVILHSDAAGTIYGSRIHWLGKPEKYILVGRTRR